MKKGGVCNPKLFKEIFDNYHRTLYNYIFYKYGNVQGAEDVVQEAFVRLWKNCGSIEPEKAQAFLYKTANNLALDEIKHQNVVLRYKKNVGQEQFEQSPEFHMEAEEFEKELMGMLSALPENQRVVFLLNRIDRMTYKEISEMLGISVKAVEKRMHKALGHIRLLVKKI